LISPRWQNGKAILDKFGQLNTLFAKGTYSTADKQKIRDGLNDLGVLKDVNAGEFVRLRQNRGSSSSGRRAGLGRW
jgi:hypothetical protein